MNKPTTKKRLMNLLFGDPEAEAMGMGGGFVLFPRRLPPDLDVLFFDEYIRALRMPVIWVTILVYAIVLIGICYYQSKFAYLTQWAVISVFIGFVTILDIYFFWELTKKWGYQNQLTLLNTLLGLLVSSLAWGIFMSWETMPDHYIGMMTTIIGSILGAAAVILSYSRISYLIFMSGLVVPGVIFMFTHQGPFYLFMGLLFCGGFFSFILINMMEYAKQRQLFDARQKLAVFNSELTRKDAELDQELLFASHIQMGIFPEPRLTISEYTFQTTILPLGRISGDYCDVVQRGDITFALVADASGHGVPAAMLTMAAKNVFSNVLTEKISPAAALAQANHEILKMIKTQDFMTGFLLKLYPSGLVEFSNAAHPSAFFQTRAGDMRLLDTSGFILGGLDDVDALYENGSVQMRPGDRLFAYTDGVTESANAANHFYGVDRLEKMLRITRGLDLGRVTTRIFSDMVSFAEGVPFRDDIAMMVIEYNQT
ncbi:PP2C family protein-serine/threonine phosphatase [Turneriella parva]|uniref:Protein serine/threonine phosphatase n=1 Tax=Turneriella parva (strain ATCC BAA-1111 / DSM 21527 / NCTC 11395 / H) TaxID=869212 RepID=I4B5W8_TURPD|nr:PP2C family protein-serine/threonine phosphatase [Turneriella parva]AFM12675.1 protein serine/threonine phosphatase [Turneriella parva DSM 21527]